MEQNEREGMKLVAICREVDRDTGKIAVYLVNGELDDHAINGIRIRAAVNPELRYFTLMAERWERYGEAITGVLKRRVLTKAAISRVGGLVEL